MPKPERRANSVSLDGAGATLVGAVLLLFGLVPGCKPAPACLEEPAPPVSSITVTVVDDSSKPLLGTVTNCSRCGKGCEGGLCRVGRCEKLDHPFAEDVEGSWELAFTEDGFLFERLDVGFVRYRFSGEVEVFPYTKATFRPYAYHKGVYYGYLFKSRTAFMVKAKDPLTTPTVLGEWPGVDDYRAARLMVDGTAVFVGQARYQDGKFASFLPSYRDSSECAQDSVLGAKSLFWTEIEPQQRLQRTGEKVTEYFGSVRAVDRDGTHLRILAAGRQTKKLTADEDFVYYADYDPKTRVGSLHCVPVRGGRSRRILALPGHSIMALGVNQPYLYLGIRSDNWKPLYRVTSARSELHRVKLPVCRPESRRR